MTTVLKIGGNQLDDPAFIAGLAQAVKKFPTRPVIVHGGGKAIKAYQEKLGLEPRYVDGQRVTDPATLEVVLMVLCGLANVTLVAALNAAGVPAQGFSGADQQLLCGVKLSHPAGDLGAVGTITHVNGSVIQQALTNGIVPVIAPVTLNLATEGGFLNVNADRAAGAVAAALGVEQVTFLTDVSGVLHGDQPIDHITRAEVQSMVADGVVRGGMVVKLNAALDALAGGVPQALITNLDGLATGQGTVVSIE